VYNYIDYYCCIFQVISQEYRDEETNTVYQTSADGNQVAYKFDETGNLMSYTDSEGNAYNAIYDTDGKITEFQNPDETKTMLSYDNNGLVSSVVNPDGSEIAYSYDSNDKMVSIDQHDVFRFSCDLRKGGGSLVGCRHPLYRLSQCILVYRATVCVPCACTYQQVISVLIEAFNVCLIARAAEQEGLGRL